VVFRGQRAGKSEGWPTTPLLQQHNDPNDCAPTLKNSAPLGKGKGWEINDCDEARRAESAEHETKTESRRRLQHVCSASL
jgi:hypothetical protein